MRGHRRRQLKSRVFPRLHPTPRGRFLCAPERTDRQHTHANRAAVRPARFVRPAMGCGASTAKATAVVAEESTVAALNQPAALEDRSLEHMRSDAGMIPQSSTVLYADQASILEQHNLASSKPDLEHMDSEAGAVPRTSTAAYAEYAAS